MIVRVKEIQAVDLAKEKEALERFGTQLDISIENDLVAELLSALRQKFGVKLNEATFRAAFQFQPQQ